MCQRYPIYRQGFIVQAEALDPDPPGAAEENELTLKPKEARKLGRQIVRNVDGYLDAIERALRETGEITRVARTDDVQVKFSPGLVIDFPLLSFRSGPFQVHLRSCVTVCLNESRSKLWVRFLLADIDGKDAEDPDAEQLKAFFAQCETWSEAISKVLISSYKEDFSAVANRAAKLSSIGSLVFYGIDTDDPEFRETMERLKYGATIDDLRQENDTVAAAIVALSDLTLRETSERAPPEAAAGSCERIYLPHESLEGRAGLFSVVTHDNVARFAVLAEAVEGSGAWGDDEDDVAKARPRKFWRPSGALTVTADLSNIYARSF